MKICIVGAGYVGLTTAVCLAHIGHNVICVDKEEDKIRQLKGGNVPFYEPDLEKLARKNLGKKLTFSSQLKESSLDAEIIFIAVGTPQQEDGRADLRAIKGVIKEINNNIKSSKVKKIVVIKSTVPPGFSKTVNLKKASLVFCPEFLREGSAVFDTLSPDRIVIGTDNPKAGKTIRKLYSKIIKPKKVPVILTDTTSAELIKYASNAFLATKISFINEIAHLCELCEADIAKIAAGMGLDKRINPHFLRAGLGYGGSCFPKDTHALNQVAGDHGHDFKLLKSVIEVNNQQRLRFINKLKNYITLLMLSWVFPSSPKLTI